MGDLAGGLGAGGADGEVITAPLWIGESSTDTCFPGRGHTRSPCLKRSSSMACACQ